MSQERPLVQSLIDGSSPPRSRVKEIRWPVFEDWRNGRTLIHSAGYRLTTADFVSAANNTSWLSPDQAALRFPLLKGIGQIFWRRQGNCFNNAAISGGVQPLEFELGYYDGASFVSLGTPCVFQFDLPDTGAVNPTDFDNRWKLSAELSVVGHPDAGTTYSMETTLWVARGDGLQRLAPTTKILHPLLDGSIDRILELRCRKATAMAQTNLQIHSWACWQPVAMTGGLK